jgi:steroid 5-alpha reductase family enzyme
MNIISFVLQCIALLCLAFAAFNLFQAPPNKPVWGWLGMFLWLLSLMISVIALHPITGTH